MLLIKMRNTGINQFSEFSGHIHACVCHFQEFIHPINHVKDLSKIDYFPSLNCIDQYVYLLKICKLFMKMFKRRLVVLCSMYQVNPFHTKSIVLEFVHPIMDWLE